MCYRFLTFPPRAQNLMSSDPTLYEILGGSDRLTEIVADMYSRVLGDPELAHFFEGVSIERLQRMNREFIGSALDGPIAYSGGDLVAVHRGRGIGRKHFSAFVGHFADALQAHGVQPDAIDAVLGRLAMYGGKITGESTVDG